MHIGIAHERLSEWHLFHHDETSTARGSRNQHRNRHYRGGQHSAATSHRTIAALSDADTVAALFLRTQSDQMSFKFLVGQNVEYTPIGDKTPGLYKIIRQMPEEQQAAELQYLIKSETESYERNVPESMLTSD
jgi:hypothetical protein